MPHTPTLVRTTIPPVPAHPALARVQGCRPGAAEAAGALFFARADPAGPFSAEDRAALAGAIVAVEPAEAEQPLVRWSRRSTYVHLLVEGWAYGAHTLPNGARQITDIILPGDMFGWASALGEGSDEEIRALEPARVAVLREDLVRRPDLPALQRSWRWARDAETRRLRAHLVSLGRRTAYKRVAHFMLEVNDRLEAVGLAADGVFTCPLTQAQLGDLLGLTTVHVNRVLQRLRGEGLLAITKRRVFIPEPGRLRARADFDPGVLG